jgi:prepilin-type processing-associated H-X9-DG protein
MQYTQDYDEQYMPQRYSDFSASWDVLISPYTGIKVTAGGAGTTNPGIFECPSDSAPRYNWGGRYKRSYALPGFWSPDADPTGWARDFPRMWRHDGLPYTSMSGIPSPSTTFMVVEMQAPNGFMREAGGATWVMKPQGSSGGNQPSQNANDASGTEVLREPHHLEGYNYLYADGHVKWLRPLSVAAIGPAGDGSVFSRGAWTILDND